MTIFWFTLYWHCCGVTCGQIMKGEGDGVVGDLVVGVIGALVRGFLFGLLAIAAGGLLGSLIMATVGAVVLIALLRAIS